ncbi:hypothetical protein AAG906_018834 [Vitis piasezkii]
MINEGFGLLKENFSLNFIFLILHETGSDEGVRITAEEEQLARNIWAAKCSGHTQCITEAEKYGPKGQGKALNGTPAKAKSDSKQRPEVDITVGLSERPPWFCSLCNTKATSKQALLLHADGKKHQAKQKEESTQNGNVSTENISKDESIGNKNVEEAKMQNPPQMATLHGSLETENENLASKQKRKLDASDNNGDRKKVGGDASGELGNGEMIQVETAEARELQLTSPAHVSTFRGTD